MNKQTLMIGAIIIIGITLGGLWSVSYQPFTEKKAVRLAAIEKLKSRIKQIDKIDSELAKVEQAIKQKMQELRSLQRSLSSDQQIPNILKFTEKLAKENNVDFKEIRINPMIQMDQYSEIPVEFSFEGKYHDVGKFLVAMENKKMLNLNSGSMAITPIKSRKSDDDAIRISVVLSCKAFMLNKVD